MKRLSLITLCALASLNTSTAFASETELHLDGPLKSSAAVQTKGQESVQKVSPKKQVQFSEKKDVIYFTNNVVMTPGEYYIHEDKTPFASDKKAFEYTTALPDEKREVIKDLDLDSPLRIIPKFVNARNKHRQEEVLDKSNIENAKNSEKLRKAAEHGGMFNHALFLAQKMELKALAIMANMKDFSDRAWRWTNINEPYRYAARALLSCEDNGKQTLRKAYVHLVKTMATLYFQMINETNSGFHHTFNYVLLTIEALIMQEEFEFCDDLLNRVKEALPGRMEAVHEKTPYGLEAKFYPKDKETCQCQEFVRAVDERLLFLQWVKDAKAKGIDYRAYIDEQMKEKCKTYY